MTHSQIEEQDIIDLYLMRQLSPEVQAEFERHFFACPDCLDRLESGRDAIAAIREGCAGGISSTRRRLLPIWAVAAGVVLATLSVTLVRRTVPPPVRPPAVPIEPAASTGPLPVVEIQSYRTGSA